MEEIWSPQGVVLHRGSIGVNLHFALLVIGNNHEKLLKRQKSCLGVHWEHVEVHPTVKVIVLPGAVPTYKIRCIQISRFFRSL